MKIINSVKEMKQISLQYKEEKKTIGFVPTMGYLHDGHLSLVKKSKEENDITILSIYVNPAQFAPEEDLDKYPRDFDRDKARAEEEGVDIMFFPGDKDMYPEGYSTYVDIEGDLTNSLCGKSRPSHFKGVATVVSKLFNIVNPDRSYFGRKDAQQSIVIKRMVEDLNMDTDIVVCPIVREEDGLAMSSRNKYLSETEREEALGLYKSLRKAEEEILKGEREASRIKETIENTIKDNAIDDEVRIDYIEVVNADTLKPLSEIKGYILIAIAVFVGKTRLIDNVILSI